MKICSNCGEYLYSFVKTCPRCGYTFDCDSKSVNEIKNSVTEKPKTRVRTMSAKKAYALAKKYYNGDGVDEDLNKAFELFPNSGGERPCRCSESNRVYVCSW